MERTENTVYLYPFPPYKNKKWQVSPCEFSNIKTAFTIPISHSPIQTCQSRETLYVKDIPFADSGSGA